MCEIPARHAACIRHGVGNSVDMRHASGMAFVCFAALSNSALVRLAFKAIVGRPESCQSDPFGSRGHNCVAHGFVPEVFPSMAGV